MFRLRRRVYLDNNATTKVSRRVANTTSVVLRKDYGNPSSRYRVARTSAVLLAEARQTVARTIGAMPDEIIFTGSASEANNQILKSMQSLAAGGKNVIVSTPIEHSSVIESLAALRAAGMMIRFCPVDGDGRVDREQLAALVDDQALLVCCMLANNEMGVVQDVRRVAEIAKARGVRVMADCVQALGKIPVDVRALDVDYASFSAHKIHGPKGVGALYVRAGSPLSPLIHGGHQENGLRAGTESVHNIAGFAASCREVPRTLARSAAIAELRDMLVDGIRHLLPGVELHSLAEGGLPNTASLGFPGFDNGEMIAFLDYHGIAVSAGSACNTQSNEPSHVLTALGLSAEQARRTLRFSLSTETTAGEIRYTLAVLGDYLQRQAMPVTMVNPAQLNEDMLFSEDLFIIDIRYAYDRRMLKGLPGSHETAGPMLKYYLHAIPKNRTILLVCQAGTDGPFAAYYLRSKGYKRVGFVMGGILGWKLFQPELYRKLGDMNKVRIEPDAGRS